MSNKPFDKLNVVDRMIRQLSPNKGIGNGDQVRITLIRGFELFNTRPYHNYETWSDGYKIELLDEHGNPFYSRTAEDLDELLELVLQERIGKSDP